MPIKVTIVEDDSRVRGSLSVLIDGSAGFRCLSSHGSAEEALAKIPDLRPDVVLMDIHLPSMSGIECVRKIKLASPEILVVMLTAYEDDELIFHALTAGANGYLIKHTPPAELLHAIVEVFRGGGPMSSNIARKVILSFHGDDAKKALPLSESLSRREHEILEYLARGFYYKEIAESLAISFETVHSHVRNIYHKLHVRSRSEAVARYRQRI